jgi:hypothetical protein
MTWGYIDGTRHHLVLLNLKVWALQTNSQDMKLDER